MTAGFLTCPRCGRLDDPQHAWHGCSHPEPGMTCESGLHAIVVWADGDDPCTKVLHPAGCAEDSCPIVNEIHDNGHDGLRPRDTAWSTAWTPSPGVYLVQSWAVAGTTSQFPLVPMEWDGGVRVIAHAPTPADLDLDDTEGHPWE